ncbi:Crp/Fnr family transcriptional regulator [Streptomyces sp. NPDC001840]
MADDTSLSLADEEQRRALEALGTRVRFPADQVIFWEGQPSHSVLIIQQGHVAVMQKAEDGTEVVLAMRGPGEVLGDEGVLMGEPRSATLKTVTEVMGLDVTAEDLIHFVNEHHLWPEMYKKAVLRRRESDDERALLARLGVRSRFARLLLDLAREVGVEENGRTVIGVALSQQDLASRIGASREAVALVLRGLRDDGVVVTGRRQMTLLDREELRKIASM